MTKELKLFTSEECDWLLDQAGTYISSGLSYAKDRDDAFIRKSVLNNKHRISEQCDMGQPTGEIYDLLLSKLKQFNIEDLNNAFISYVRYFEGGFFVRHVDGPERIATVIIQLSDSEEYSGGNLIVKDTVVGREKGNTVIFNTQVPHELTEVFSGIRNALVIWIEKNSLRRDKTIL